MTINSNKLVRISTYAKQHDTSAQTVYNWIANGKVKAVYIDSVAFIISE